MTRTILAEPLTRQAFAPFGDVIAMEGAESFAINGGRCRRYHDLARVEAAGAGARVLINLFRSEPVPMPLRLDMVERHPLGSQAFIPLDGRPFLVIVCADLNSRPDTPRAFLTGPGQGVNFHRNIWHAPLAPLGNRQDFVVIDRGGEGVNLEEHHFAEAFEVVVPGKQALRAANAGG
jgi:ureidoglycolate lyase